MTMDAARITELAGVHRDSRLTALLLRPELTAFVGVIVVFAFFALTAGNSGFLTFTGTKNYLQVAAEIGILATPVTLLLVAGEFDLSVGTMIAAGGIAVAFPISFLHWPLWGARRHAVAEPDAPDFGAFRGGLHDLGVENPFALVQHSHSPIFRHLRMLCRAMAFPTSCAGRRAVCRRPFSH
jgi:hypothetical protein